MTFVDLTVPTPRNHYCGHCELDVSETIYVEHVKKCLDRKLNRPKEPIVIERDIKRRPGGQLGRRPPVRPLELRNKRRIGIEKFINSKLNT